MMSVTDAILLRARPGVRDPEGLVEIRVGDRAGRSRHLMSHSAFEAIGEDLAAPLGLQDFIADWGQFLAVLPKLDMVVAHHVFAGWYGAPEHRVKWEEFQGILDRRVAAGCGQSTPG